MRIKSLIYFLLLLAFNSCSSQEKMSISKMNGISFVASSEVIDSTHIQPILQVNANWAAVIPFAFMPAKDSSTILFNIPQQWWGEREEGVKTTIELMHNKGIKVMLKPQIWVRNGEFKGNIAMQSEEQWQDLERNYRDYILFYAHLAEVTNVELFCIGTELNRFVSSRSDFWGQLITEIKSIYKGQLTYAENWDAKTKVSFWANLDYIGIDAYYPISGSKTSTEEEALLGWKLHKSEIINLQKKFNLPILFTEFGYRSRDFAGRKPWESERLEGQVNHEAQENLTIALIQTFWKEPWFVGGFHWKWFHNHQESGGLNDNQFTIQNKPAQVVLQQYYKAYK